MAESKDFVLWFLQQLPAFLMTSPISYFLGFGFLAFTIRLFKDIISVSN